MLPESAVAQYQGKIDVAILDCRNDPDSA